MTCPACTHPVAVLLGTLGALAWVRCRACGLTYATEEMPTTTCAGCAD
jgi:transcription elongation factor Elf1